MAVTLVLGNLRQIAMLSFRTQVSDGVGGYTETQVEIDPPQWRCEIEKASARAIERAFGGTVTAHATHILRGRFHPGITMKTQIAWTDRAGIVHTANVLDVDNTEGAAVETVVLVSEIIQ